MSKRKTKEPEALPEPAAKEKPDKRLGSAMQSARWADPENGVEPGPIARLAEREDNALDFREGTTPDHVKRLFALLGTRDGEAAGVLMESLGKGVKAKSQALRVNAAAALLAEMEPRDMAERLLMTQMIGAHSAAMDMTNRAINAGHSEVAKDYGGLATRFMRAFTAQVEALHKLRNGGQQRMTVEHVTVNEGGQAIVGNVNGSRNGKGNSGPGGGEGTG